MRCPWQRAPSEREKQLEALLADATRTFAELSKPIEVLSGNIAIDERRADISGYRATRLALPKPPPVSTGGMAFDDSSYGGLGAYLNTNSAFGQAGFGLYFPGYQWLAELAQRSEYRQPTETTAKELTRKWIILKSKGEGDKTARIKDIETDFESFKIQELFRRVSMHDGFYGLGMIYVDIKGQNAARDLPLTLEPEGIAVDSLNGFTAIEPMWITPLMWNASDPTLPTFYKPEAWMVLGTRTHSDRLISFISREAPDIIKPAYNFGGISLTQLIEPYVSRWLKTVDAVNRLINNFSMIFLQTDMTAVFGGKPDTSLVNRMKYFAKHRDNQNVLLTDKEREMLLQIAVPLSGLSELQAQAQEHMAAPTHLPLVVLTGITPAGLNASSEGEIEVYHDWIHGQQEALFTEPLKKILKIIQLNRYGNVDDDIVFGFVPLKELSGEALARVTKMKAEAGSAYISAGVIDPDEERERLMKDEDSGYVNLSGPAPGPPPLQTEQALGGGSEDGWDE